MPLALAWFDRANCVDCDPEPFFPEVGAAGDARAATEIAKRVCEPCEVRTECLAYAMAHPELEGVWGGLTEGERGVLRGTPRSRRKLT